MPLESVSACNSCRYVFQGSGVLAAAIQRKSTAIPDLFEAGV